MKKKASQKNGNTESTSKGYTFKFGPRELVLWVGLAFLSLMWMFVLGIMVGRGLMPSHLNQKIKEELIALNKKETAKAELAAPLAGQSSPETEHLGFYDVLTDKKEEARLKSVPVKSGKKTEVVGGKKISEQTGQTPLKTAVVNKEKMAARGASPPKQGQQESFTLQVASLNDRVKAEKLVSSLKQKGYHAYVVAVGSSGNTTYHRVRVGHYTDRDEAIKTASRLKGEKFEPIIMRE